MKLKRTERTLQGREAVLGEYLILGKNHRLVSSGYLNISESKNQGSLHTFLKLNRMKQTPAGSVYFKNLKELLVPVIANNNNHLFWLSVDPQRTTVTSLKIGKEPMVFRAFI